MLNKSTVRINKKTHRISNSSLDNLHVVEAEPGGGQSARPELHPISAADGGSFIPQTQYPQNKLGNINASIPNKFQESPKAPPQTERGAAEATDSRQLGRVISLPAVRQQHGHQRDAVAQRVVHTENHGLVRREDVHLPQGFIKREGRRIREIGNIIVDAVLVGDGRVFRDRVMADDEVAVHVHFGSPPVFAAAAVDYHQAAKPGVFEHD